MYGCTLCTLYPCEAKALCALLRELAAPWLRKPQLASTQIVTACMLARAASLAESAGFLSNRPAWAAGRAQASNTASNKRRMAKSRSGMRGDANSASRAPPDASLSERSAQQIDALDQRFRRIRLRRGGAPHRARPRNVLLVARDDVHVQLRHEIAERRDIQLVRPEHAEHARGAIDFLHQRLLLGRVEIGDLGRVGHARH